MVINTFIKDLNVFRIITGNSEILPTLFDISKSPLLKIVDFVWNSREDSESGIRNEGGRLISNLIKRCNLNKS